MTPPVFTVDTNVIVAGVLTSDPRSPVAIVLDAMISGNLIYLMSPALLDEYRGVLVRSRIAARHGLSEPEVDDLLVEITANAIWREPSVAAPAPDRNDDHLWALLAAHSGSALITGDQLLLNNPPVGHSVMTPTTWVQRFTGAAGAPC